MLADLRRRATSMRDLGTRLEVLTKQFLQPKLYGNRFPNVWVWFSVMFPIIPQSVTTRAYPEAVC